MTTLLSPTLFAEDKLVEDQREDLQACYEEGSSCGSCQIQTVAELRDDLPFIDILGASVEKTEGNNFLVMKLKVANSIPSSPNSLTSYSLALDLDGDPDTGFRADQSPLGVFPSLGVDLWVNLSLEQGEKAYSVFIGPNNIKKATSTSGLLEHSISKDGKTIVFTVPLEDIERKLTLAYLHRKPEFKVELEETKWVAFTTRATSHFSKENPICDFHPDEYFEESSEGCLLSPLL